MQYRTKAGDLLDAICLAHYGAAAVSPETVLAANPGLAVKGPLLPAGLVIELPEIAETTAATDGAIRLWA